MTKIIEKIKVKCFFSKNFWFFGKKISLSGYFLWSIPLIIHSEHLPIQKYLVISTVALACRLIYFRESNCHVFPCLQFCVHILTFLKASSLETKWVTPNLHLKVISRLSFWLKKELVANLRKKYFFEFFEGFSSPGLHIGLRTSGYGSLTSA